MSDLDFYASHGSITDPGEYVGLYDGLPEDIPSVCRAVQGLLIHVGWAPTYGIHISDERREELQLRHVSKTLARIVELDDLPLTEERPLERRLVGNCRDFTVLTCSILRTQGVPARARCGFGAYFLPGKHEDHWVCEYWNGPDERWQLVDAQLDEFQRGVLNLPFDVMDVPRDQFVVAGKAWQMCLAGEADPDTFGLSVLNEHGLWWVRQNLVRDVAALNKMEMLPWDGWGLAEGMHDDLPDGDISLLDRIAALSTRPDAVFDELRGEYDGDSRLRVPPLIRSHTAAGDREVSIAGA